MADEQNEQNDALKERKVLITSTEVNGHTPVGVNGIVRDVPHNKTVTVTQAEYEVLQGADLGTGKLTDMPDDDDATGEVRNISAEGDAKVGTEASPVQAPASPAATSSEANPLLEGEQDDDALKGGDVTLDEGGDDQGEKPDEKPAGNKPAGRTKGAGTRKAKAVEGGRD